jgi:hypothetical protein
MFFRSSKSTFGHPDSPDSGHSHPNNKPATAATTTAIPAIWAVNSACIERKLILNKETNEIIF